MDNQQTIKELLDLASTELKEVCERPRFESETLLGSVLQKERIWLHLHQNDIIDSKKFLDLVSKRRNNVPLEYLTNTVSFYSENFSIEEGVLIPRPETEILVELASDYIGGRELLIAEVGVGSGVISIMLAKQNPKIKVIGVDINPKALELTRKNAEKHGVSDRIDLRLGSLLEPIDEEVDVLVSNPPYIAESYKLPKNVEFEPKEALFGGERGDELIQDLIDSWYKKHIPVFFCEYGYDQKSYVKEFVKKYDKIEISFYQDLNGLDRGFTIKKYNKYEK